MRLQALLTAQGGLGTGISSFGIAAVIAALVCLLCTEVICIGVLIRKMISARKAEQENAQFRKHYGIALIGLTAVSKPSFLAITVLAWMAVIGALVFAVLLAVCRIKGYDFAVVLKTSEQNPKEEPAVPTAAVTAEPQEPAVSDDVEPAVVAAAVCEETPFAVFDAEETPTDSEPEEYEEPIADADATELPFEDPEESDGAAVFSEEETVSEEATEVAETEPKESETAGSDSPAATEILPPAAPVAPKELSSSPKPLSASDGTQPYKVVEKVVKETYKEVVKETPANVAPNDSTSAADAVFHKLSDLLDLELQRRKLQDLTQDSEGPIGQARKETSEEEDPALAADAEEIEEEDIEDEEDAALDADDPRDEDDVDEDSDGDRFTGNERIVGFDEQTGCYLVAHYRKSFEAKLIQARPHIKKYYSEIKNALLSYSETKSRISWACETFSNERQPIVRINAKPRLLELYLALDPASLEGSVYRGKDVGSKKKYADTPFLYKIRTPRKFTWAMELIQQVCEEQGMSPIDIEHTNYAEQYAFDTTEGLIARGLIREYIRQEKPATTFELDPDHVPEVPVEDASVIPANANFSWEFDNDAMAEKPLAEEESAEEIPSEDSEPIAEEGSDRNEDKEPEVPAASETRETASEPSVTAAPSAPVSETFRETVKVTEMHYTERYYAGQDPVYEQVISVDSPMTEPLTASAELSENPSDFAEPNGSKGSEQPAESAVEKSASDTSVRSQESNESSEPEPEDLSAETDSAVADVSDEEPIFAVSASEDFRADKFDGADPFADFRDEEPAERTRTPQESVPERAKEPFDRRNRFSPSVFRNSRPMPFVTSDPEPTEVGDSVLEPEDAMPSAEAVFAEDSEPLYEDADRFDTAIAENSDGEESDFASEDLGDSDGFYEETEETADLADSEESYDGASEDSETEVSYDDESYDPEEVYEEGAYEEEPYESEEYGSEEYDSEYETEYATEDSYDPYGDPEEEEDAYAEDFIYDHKPNSSAPVASSERAGTAPDTSLAVVDLCGIEDYFEEDSIINLQSLKEAGLILPTAVSLKVHCSGALSKRFTVEANLCTNGAIRSVYAVGGSMNIVR